MSQLSNHPSLASKNILCVFPQAPPHPVLGAPAWWDLSHLIQAFTMSMQAQNTDSMATAIRTEPNGLKECREKVVSMLTSILSEEGLFDGDENEGKLNVPLIIGGFSQGAMTALDVSLSLCDSSEGKRLVYTDQEGKKRVNLVILSGAPIVVDESHRRLKTLLEEMGTTINVFMTHGKNDFMIPVVANTWLEELFNQFSHFKTPSNSERQGALTVENILHNGAHELGSSDVVAKLFSNIAKALG